MDLDPNQLLTTREACAYLKVDRGTLLEMRKRGELKAVRFGKRFLRYRLRDLVRLVDRHARTG